MNKYKTENPTLSCVWHESVGGQKGEDIASTFIQVLQHDRDYRSVIHFTDNCSAQNKNWILFPALVNLVNLDICDFDNFRACIKHRNITLKNMSFGDFFRLKPMKSVTKVQRAGVHLADMRINQFCRRERSLYFKARILKR